MNDSYIILLIILGLGLISKNNSIIIAVSILIALKFLNLNNFLTKLDKYGLKIGIIILTIGILSPFALGKYSLNDLIEALKSPLGICAIISGVLVILFTSKGYDLLISQPSMVIPIVLGGIIGLIIFDGVPVGPLISAGITVILYDLYKIIENLISSS